MLNRDVLAHHITARDNIALCCHAQNIIAI